MSVGRECAEWLEEAQLESAARRAYDAFRKMRVTKNDPAWDDLTADLKAAFRYIAKSALNGYYEATP